MNGSLRCPNPACRHAHGWLTPKIPSVVLARSAQSDAPRPLPGDGELAGWLRGRGPKTAAFGQVFRAAIFLRAMRSDAEEPFYADLCDALGVNSIAAGEVLDAGCGAGNLAFELARRGGWSVTGLDADAHLLRWAERAASGDEFEAPVSVHSGRVVVGRMRVRRIAGSVRFIHGDLLAPPFGDGQFGLVALVNVLDAVADPAGALSRAVELVRPGGHLLFASPDAWNAATTPVNRWLAATERGWDRVFGGVGLETVADTDDLEWRLRDSPRLHHLYRVHARLLRKPD